MWPRHKCDKVDQNRSDNVVTIKIRVNMCVTNVHELFDVLVAKTG